MRWTILVLVALISHVKSHSWIACSDYTEKNGADWDPEKCRGFPRSAARFANKNAFGLDRGFDYKPAAGSPGCKTTYDPSEYTDDYPKAIYFPDQQVILAHPMKNHGADPGCTSPYIPDSGNAIYRGKVNTDKDQTFGYYKKRLVADLGVSPVGANGDVSKYPKLGYQNAPHFCKDTDKSMGTYSFNVPKNLKPGEYTFLWRWSFNGPQDIYATCFDVIIAANKKERDEMLARREGASFYVACGGKTSDNSRGSETGCDDINLPRPPPPEPSRPTRPGRPRPPGLPLPPRPPPPPPGKAIFKVDQISGEIMLTKVENGIKKRFVSVNFDCPVHASFWNARVLIEHKQEVEKYHFAATQYDLVQEQRSHLKSRKIYFTATFEMACSIVTQPPIAYIVMEE